MNLRQFVKYWLWRDTTHHGEFMAMRQLLPDDASKVIVDVGATTPLIETRKSDFTSAWFQRSVD
ncbi:MAG TPA: hypothetical protein VN784_11660 [Candidatus Limnocylindrales bacterium]|nr:hypothetical protein [Candidatus Limnocylindrales bacterium]